MEFKGASFSLRFNSGVGAHPAAFCHSGISNGLANSSGELGNNLMDHVMEAEPQGVYRNEDPRISATAKWNLRARFRNVRIIHFLRGLVSRAGGGAQTGAGIDQSRFGPTSSVPEISGTGPSVLRFWRMSAQSQQLRRTPSHHE